MCGILINYSIQNQTTMKITACVFNIELELVLFSICKSRAGFTDKKYNFF